MSEKKAEKYFRALTGEDIEKARKTLIETFHRHEDEIFDDEAIKNLLKLVRVLEKRK
jgi:hypothetical protein